MPEPPEFFIDRSLGRRTVPEALRAVGLVVYTMADVYGRHPGRLPRPRRLRRRRHPRPPLHHRPARRPLHAHLRHRRRLMTPPAAPLPLHVRQATTDDLDRVVELLHHAYDWLIAQGITDQWPGPFPPQAIQELLRRGEVYVASSGDAVIATFTELPTRPRAVGRPARQRRLHPPPRRRPRTRRTRGRRTAP